MKELILTCLFGLYILAGYAQGYIGARESYIRTETYNSDSFSQYSTYPYGEDHVLTVENTAYIAGFYINKYTEECYFSFMLPRSESFTMEFVKLLNNSGKFVQLNNTTWVRNDLHMMISYKWLEDFKCYGFLFKPKN